MHRTLGPSVLLGTLLTAAITTSPTGQGTASWSQLDVSGDQVRIYRDEYGVPHIFAETSRGLYETYGYVVAEDRLWQLEVNRRAGRGRLAEIFGAGSVMADRTVRTLGYTDAELDEQFAQLPAADQERFESYVRGINRYVDEVVVPDPSSRDYFNGADPNAVMSAAFTSALDTLGPDPSAWSTQPRDVTRFRHALYPAIPEVATMLESNKGTYAQLVVLKNPRIQSENILTLGQSGFIRRMPTGDAELNTHFRDQLPLYRSFLYKPMRLFVNTRLEH